MNSYWTPSNDYDFAVAVKEVLPQLLSELHPSQPSKVEMVTIPSNEELLQKYLLTDEDNELEMLFTDNDDEPRFTSPNDLPSEITFLRVNIGSKEYELFYDEFGLNVDFCPYIHLQCCYTEDTAPTMDEWKRLSSLLAQKAELLLLPANISYSADSLCAVEDIIDSAPYIDITVPIDTFTDKPETTLRDMFLCFQGMN